MDNTKKLWIKIGIEQHYCFFFFTKHMNFKLNNT